jgi:FkbM family methyltransferase
LLRDIFHRLLQLSGIARVRGHSFIRQLVPQDAVIADFGAHRGEFCSILSGTTKIRSCLCLEANPMLVRDLIEGNTKQSTMKIIHAALVGIGAPAELMLQVSENPEASSVFLSVSGVFGVRETVNVPTMTLDAVMDILSEPRVHMIKMDIEGAEIDVLRTANRKTLARIDQITVEFHDFIDPDMREAVQTVRGRLKREQGFVEINANWPYTDDILFINRQCIERIGRLRFWSMIYTSRVAYLIRGMLFKCRPEKSLLNE